MRKIGAILGMTGLLLAGMWLGSDALRQWQTEKRTAQVVCQTLEYETLSSTVKCGGTLEYASRTAVYAGETLYVRQLLAEPGDIVTAGQPLLQVEAAETDALAALDDLFNTEALVEAMASLLGYSTSTVPTEYVEVSRIQEGSIFVLESPMDGVVVSVDAEQNQVTEAGHALLLLADPDNLQMRCQMSESLAAKLSTGLPCSIRCDSLQDSVYAGTVQQMMPYAYQTVSLTGNGSTVVDVILSFDAPENTVAAGYSANAEIRTGSADDAILIPYEALYQDEAQQEYVYLLQNGLAVRQDVETGYELDAAIQVTSGLTVGQRLIVQSDRALCEGMPAREAD